MLEERGSFETGLLRVAIAPSERDRISAEAEAVGHALRTLHHAA
ncbi:hypothetical protein [Moorena producens]